MIYDAIIIGGGPAGLMAANVFEEHNINYILLEKNEKCGRKLLLSGGKRCNVTNDLPLKAFIETLTIRHKKFLYPMLHQFGPDQVIAFFKERDLELILENSFKYFPKTEKSSSVLDALLQDINSERIKYLHHVKKIIKVEDIFHLTMKDDTLLYCKHVIIGTGSHSYPTTGSNGEGLLFAKHFDIPFYPYTPAETHVFSEYVKTKLIGLKGVALKHVLITLTQSKVKHQGDVMFTHYGLSGPGIMHLSEFIYDDIESYGSCIVSFSMIDLDETQLFDYLQTHKQKLLYNALDTILSTKVIDVALAITEVSSKKIADMKHADLKKLCYFLTHMEIKIDHVADKEQAYVNKGGIDTKALDPKTMEVKHVKGLYFVGEVTDIHGPIGGYNHTIAMSSGYASARAVIENIQV